MTEAIPIPAAGAKPWYFSSTMIAGVAQIGGGIALVAVALIGGNNDYLLPGAGAITTGFATLRGRASATQPILPSIVTKLVGK